MATRAKRRSARISEGAREFVRLQDTKIEVQHRGKTNGKPLLLLHSEDNYETTQPFVEELGRKYRLIVPRMPGFGRSTLPERVRNIDDISYLYLDLLDHYDLRGVTVVGFSVGGWLAAEMASKNCSRLARLVLVCPLGCKFGGKFDRDIEDIYFLPFDTVKGLKFHDPGRDPRVLTELGDREAYLLARHRESTARLCWNPYFHNPGLRYRLNRITVETLIVWGAKDGLVKPAYGRKYAKHIPGARFAAIPNAAHFPHIEQPEAFMAELGAFLG